MAVFARLMIFGFVVLTVIYVSLSFYARATRRARLETRWEEEGRPGDRDAFVAEGLRSFEPALRRKLVIGVYVLPTLVFGTVVYVLNTA